jgi:chromosome segregation ATPase
MNTSEKIIKNVELNGKLNFINEQVAAKVAEISEIEKGVKQLEAAGHSLQEAKESLKGLLGGELITAFAAEAERLTQVRIKAETGKEKLISESQAIQQDIDDLQAELEGFGIKLSVGKARPKTSII